MRSYIILYRLMCVVLLTCVFGRFISVSAQEWTGVNYGVKSQQDVITLSFSQDVPLPQITRLDEGDPRLVLDWDELSAGALGQDIDHGQKALAGQGPVTRFRFARRGAQGLRLVLELGSAAKYQDIEKSGTDIHLRFAGRSLGYDVPTPRINPRLGGDQYNHTAQADQSSVNTARQQQLSQEIYSPKKRIFAAGERPYPRVAPYLGVIQGASLQAQSGTGQVGGVYAAPVKKSNKPVVVLDPGHGGYDPGAIGARGTKEKLITSSVTSQLVERLKATGRYEVVVTRSRDVYVEHEERLRIAREHGADLFISIHADATKNGLASGASVYTLSDRSKNRSKKITHTQNWILDVDLSEQTASVGDILVDLAQRKTSSHSSQFAARLVSELKKDIPLVRNTHRRAGYYVLLAPDVPAVLLEVGFISNASDEARLNKTSEQKKIVAAVTRAINGYFDAKKP